MNHDDIKKIVSELYAIDPELKSREKEVIEILRALAIKPNAKYDPAFSAELRAKLLLELDRRAEAKTHAPSGIFAAFARKDLRYGIGGFLSGALAGAVIIGNIVIPNLQAPNLVTLQSTTSNIPSAGVSAVPSATVRADNTGSGSAQKKIANGNMSTTAAGSALSTMMSVAAVAPEQSTSASGDRSAANYHYTGAAFSQDQEKLEVYKKIVTENNVDSYEMTTDDAITDVTTIISMAEHPGEYSAVRNTIMNNSTGTIDLDTPSMIYTDGRRTDANGMTETFLVPAFVFRMAGSANSSDQSVTVPLINDIAL